MQQSCQHMYMTLTPILCTLLCAGTHRKQQHRSSVAQLPCIEQRKQHLSYHLRAQNCSSMQHHITVNAAHGARTCSGRPVTCRMRRYACISSCATMLPSSSRGSPYMTSSALTLQCCCSGAMRVAMLLTGAAPKPRPWPTARTTDGIVLQAISTYLKQTQQQPVP
jgi:hypothetical protein